MSTTQSKAVQQADHTLQPTVYLHMFSMMFDDLQLNLRCLIWQQLQGTNVCLAHVFLAVITNFRCSQEQIQKTKCKAMMRNTLTHKTETKNEKQIQEQHEADHK